MVKNGKFVLSIDLELYWGVRDKFDLISYKENLDGVYTSVPKVLNLFRKYNVGATWATVGFLFAKNKKDLLRYVPNNLPAYRDQKLSPYAYLINDEQVETYSEFHFAIDLINQISKHERNEIGTHTFSHFYCLESGQNALQFREDLDSALRIAKDNSFDIKSIVFPRNQVNEKYLNILSDSGIRVYRGTEGFFSYKPAQDEQQNYFKRLFRFVDTYVNLSGHNTYRLEEGKNSSIINLPSSRFLRPFNPRLAVLEKKRMKRIKNSMTHAANRGEIFHLWWHPHNFGTYQEENLSILVEILEHYKFLNENYNFENVNMAQLASTLT